LKRPKSSEKRDGPAAGSLSKGSVIVYVWRQRDAEVVAESIQASGVPGGVVHYHGGMDSGTRANAYNKVQYIAASF
jgi:superfamily II DNA helicase RecQ